MVALLVFRLATLKKLLDGSKMYMYVHVVRDKFGDGKKKSSLHRKKYSSLYKCSLGYTFLRYVLN